MIAEVQSSSGGGARVVGRYAMFDAIASGGMATVHLGKLIGPHGFSRTVAIKRLHENLASDPTFVAMMIDEARLVSRIDHPNVVPTLDVVAVDGELLIVMEYVSGGALSRVLAALAAAHERMPVGIAVALVVDALHGLHAAHEATSERGQPMGIVHRDVSPQNLLIGLDGTARVADFGVAKAAGRLQATATGQIKGKLAYMAPEQLLGQAIDRRVDVFAAGIVLWEALAGRGLFAHPTEAATISAVLSSKIDPPGSVAGGLPDGLDAIVMRALEREPAARFATAHDFAIALEEALPLPRAHEVGAWIAPWLEDEVRARAARVKEIESASALMSVPEVPGSAPALDDTRKELGHAPTAVAPSAKARRSRAPLAAGAIGIALLAVAAYFGLARATAPSAPPPLASAPLARSAPSAAPPAAAISAAPAVSAVPAIPVTPVIVPTVSARARDPKPPPVATRRPPPPSAPDCDPPFTLDKDGVRVPKRECLGVP